MVKSRIKVERWRQQVPGSGGSGCCEICMGCGGAQSRSGSRIIGGREKTARRPGVMELRAWKSRDVFEPFTGRNVAEAVVNTRWELTWKIIGGKKCAEARLVAEGVTGDHRLRQPSLVASLSDFLGRYREMGGLEPGN